jgi:hypothetical protein
MEVGGRGRDCTVTDNPLAPPAAAGKLAAEEQDSVEQQLADMRAQLSQQQQLLQSALGADPSPAGGVNGGEGDVAVVPIHSVAPTNLHQLSTVLCLDPAVPQARKAKYLVASFCVVALQMAALSGVSEGTESPSCMDSSDCPTGDYCQPNDGHCGQCMDNPSFWYPHLNTAVFVPENWVHNDTGFQLWSDVRICDSGTTEQHLDGDDDSEWMSHIEKCVVRRMRDRGLPFGRGWTNKFMTQINARFVCRDHAAHLPNQREREFCDGCFDPHLSEDVLGQADGWNNARAEEGGMMGTIARNVSLMQ